MKSASFKILAFLVSASLVATENESLALRGGGGGGGGGGGRIGAMGGGGRAGGFSRPSAAGGGFGGGGRVSRPQTVPGQIPAVPEDLLRTRMSAEATSTDPKFRRRFNRVLKEADQLCRPLLKERKLEQVQAATRAFLTLQKKLAQVSWQARRRGREVAN
jgi:hypothetical protein